MKRRSPLPLAAIGGALAAGALVCWVLGCADPDPFDDLELRERAVPGRLALRPSYAPWAPPGPGVGDRREVGGRRATRRGLRSFRRLHRAAESDPSAANLQRLATVLLEVGEREGAVERLKQAVRLRPDLPELWSDLSAAHLARFVSGEGAFSAVRALGAAERALALRDDLPEALFNRASALEALHLRGRAAGAWQVVEELEPMDSGWRSEAAAAVDRLERSSPAESWPEVRRRFLEDARAGDPSGAGELVAVSLAGARDDVAFELLFEWARKVAEGRESEATAALDAVRAIGGLLAEGDRDHLLADVVRGIEATGGVPRSPARDRLVAGLSELAEGRRLSRASRYGEARPRFEAARRELESAGSLLAGLATHDLAVCLYYDEDFDGSEDLMRGLRSEIDSDRYPVVAALAARMIGLIGLVRVDLGEPFGPWREAGDAYARAGDAQGRAGIDALLASGYDLLGLTDQGWSHRLAALDQLPATTSPRRAVSLLGRSGDAAADIGETAAALAFHDEAVAVASARGGLLERAVARHSRGGVRALVGDSAGAREDFAVAWNEWEEVADEGLRRSLAAEIRRSEGMLPPSGDLAAVIAAQTDALEYLRAGPKKLRLEEILATRARAHRAAGDLEAAEEDFRSALAEVESIRDGVDDEEARIAFLDLERRQRIVDDLVELLAADRPAQALAVVEQGRARALLDRFESEAENDGVPLTPLEAAEHALARLPGELPSGTLMLIYHALPERLLIWPVDRSGVGEPIEGAAGAAELAARVGELREALRGGASETRVRDLSAALYDLLIREPLAKAGTVEHLVVIPDKALHLVPFEALYDDAAGGYVLEATTVILAPAVRVYLRALEHSRALGAASSPTLLAVGDPEIDRSVFPTLPRLPAAVVETSAIAALYDRSTLVTGAAADRDTVLREASAHEILHLATHAVANPESVLGSALVLAPSGEGSGGTVYAGEIGALDLSGVRLAVLAGCDTGTGAVRAGEGAVSLARAFLAAGVPAVVQSLWAIEDDAAAELLVDFHTRLRAGADPATALRAAQLAFLNRDASDHSRASVWGALVLVGGVDPMTSDSD